MSDLASVPYTFVAGTKAQSAQVNANFAAIVDFINDLSIPTTPVSIANGGTGAANAAAALTNLGLGQGGLIIPCTASSVGTVITLTRLTGTPSVLDYQLGVSFIFECPSALTGPVTIADGSDSLTALQLNDNPGTTATASLLQNQLCLITYEPTLGVWCLLNPPAAASVGGRLINIQLITATGVYTPTAGTTSVEVWLLGGGGAGGSCAATSSGSQAAAAGGGGGSGSLAVTRLTSGFSGLAVVIGAGGTPGAAGPNVGGNGGASTFGTLMNAPGGFGGAAGTQIFSSGGIFIGSAPGGAGGALATGGLMNAGGNPGGTALAVSNNVGSANAAVIGYGNGAGSVFGGGASGYQGITSSNGSTGLAAAAGGSGAYSTASGGAGAGGPGAPGVCIIREFA